MLVSYTSIVPISSIRYTDTIPVRYTSVVLVRYANARQVRYNWVVPYIPGKYQLDYIPDIPIRYTNQHST